MIFYFFHRRTQFGQLSAGPPSTVVCLFIYFLNLCATELGGGGGGEKVMWEIRIRRCDVDRSLLYALQEEKKGRRERKEMKRWPSQSSSSHKVLSSKYERVFSCISSRTFSS